MELIDTTPEQAFPSFEDLQKDEALHCPSCGEDKFTVIPLAGKEGERFIRILCHLCGEHLLFQTPDTFSSSIEFDDVSEKWKTKHISYIQKEWEEWLQWKQKHLVPTSTSRPYLSKFTHFLLGLLLGGSVLFFILDRWHLLDPVFENPEARQKYITELAEQFLEVPCFPSIMKVKIRTVPIHYTRERPVHKNYIQYGEAGIYWGEEQIKIHRSNFWFFGWPKKNQLLNTLVHELRHRSSPGLGHNSTFYELVEKDMQCVLDYMSAFEHK